MRQPIQSDIRKMVESTVKTPEDLESLKVNYNGTTYSIPFDKVVDFVSTGFYRFLWSKYQSELRTTESKVQSVYEQRLRELGGDPDKIRQEVLQKLGK